MMVPDSGRAARDVRQRRPVDRQRVRCPVLVVAAEDDRFIPRGPVAGSRCSTTLAGDAAGHGHMIILEPDWEQIAAPVARWAVSL